MGKLRGMEKVKWMYCRFYVLIWWENVILGGTASTQNDIFYLSSVNMASVDVTFSAPESTQLCRFHFKRRNSYLMSGQLGN